MNMNFDRVYKHLCESLRGDELLADDGKREVYYSSIQIGEYLRSGDPTEICVLPVVRMEQNMIQYWDNKTGPATGMYVVKYKNLEEAINGLATDYLLNNGINSPCFTSLRSRKMKQEDTEYIVNRLRHIFQPYAHFPGEWGFAAFSDHDILDFSIEVDLDYYRTHGLRSIIQDDTTEDGSIMDL